ncbi:MAG: flavodoxin family protein [Usitatibacter sp.]
MKALVVCYSRSGNTHTLGHRIAVALDAPIDDIATAPRRGILGYLRAGREAWLKRTPEILPSEHDPGEYDLVVIGTPVFNWSLSGPVRTYLKSNASRFRKVAFFCTMGGSGSERAFRQMQQAAGQAPVATFARTHAQLADADIDAAVEAFASPLRSGYAKAA